MGNDTPNEYQQNNDDLKFKSMHSSGQIDEQKLMNEHKERIDNYPLDPLDPDANELLQPIRRHSNFAKNRYINNLSTNNLSNSTNSQHNSLGFSSHSKNTELPTLVERNKNRKLSQQYCADFKKSYMEGNKNSFLNHLADSLNHGITIPKEELEKFREEYIPKYFFDMRNVDDPRTGMKCWKNYGKVYPDENFRAKMKKIEINKIGSSELFYVKRSWLYRYLMNNYARKKTENPLMIINRNNILEDSFNQFLKIKEVNLARPLKIRFVNEQIEDEEGVYREWYTCMFKEIISPNKKLFILNPYKSLEPNTVLFYPKYPGMRLEIYEFIGKLISKAIADIVFIRNLIINRVLLKSIIRRPIVLDDIKYYNLELYQQLKYINDNQIRGNKQLETVRFVWRVRDQNNLIQELELVPGGRNILLNDSNKITFIDKVIYVEAIMPYEEQIKYTQKGLLSLMGQEVRGVFSVEEINFLLSGQDDIDLNDWKENTIYKGNYNQNHPTIIMFWDKLSRMKKNEIIKFLEFATGTGSVPIDGFGSLKGVGGRIQKFTIEPYTNYAAENPDQYTFHKIDAKRAYNTIILPQYRNRQELEQAMNMILYHK